MSTTNNEISCIYYQMVKQALRDGNLPSSRKLPLSSFFKQLSPQRNLSSLSCRFLFFFSPLTSSGYPLLASTGHYLPSCAPHQQVWALQPPSWPTITPLAMCMQLGSMHREGSPHTSKKGRIVFWPSWGQKLTFGPPTTHI